MLQQTTVAAVIPYFERWMERWPRVEDLAAAQEEEVLTMWQGLGYYRRARHLQAAARVVTGSHGGVFPRDYASLRALPGAGDYTAHAVRAFAFDEPAPVLDANIVRVMARLGDVQDPVDTSAGRDAVRARLEELLPARGGRDFISALMDLGATVCRAGPPPCPRCPVRRHCQAREPALLPRKAPRKPVINRRETAAWWMEGGELLLEQSSGPRWRGLWRLPAAPPEAGRTLAKLNYSIVRERVTLEILQAPPGPPENPAVQRRTIHLSELASVPMPSPHRRAVALVRKTLHI